MSESSNSVASPSEGATGAPIEITDEMVEAAAACLDVTWGYLDPDGAVARRQARKALEAAFRASRLPSPEPQK